MIPGENNTPPVRTGVRQASNNPIAHATPETSLRTGGLRTGGLKTGNLDPLPRPKFPQVGRIPEAAFQIDYTPRKLADLAIGDFLVTQPLGGSVLVQRGYVLCIDPASTASPVLNYRIPPELDFDDPAAFAVADGQSLAIKVDTNDKDVVTAVSAVVVATSTASAHAQPPPSADGEGAPPPLAGTYYYRIADFYLDGSVLKTKQIHAHGVILHRPSLQEFYNLPAASGTRYEVFKKWNAVDTRYEFRPLVQLTGTDVVPVIFPLQTGEPPYEEIRYRGLKPKDTFAQIQVHAPGGDTDEAITIEGNGVDGSAGINLDGAIQVADGLVTVLTEGTRGDDFDLVNYPCDQSTAPASPNWTIYFRKGLAFLADPGGTPTTTLVQYDGFSCAPPDGP